ncbi:MAG: hypothetical protein ACYTFW_01900 [Planctomycetota bacterium]|jgi:hypothetical protein
MNTKIQKVVLIGLCSFIVVCMGAKPEGNRIQDGVLMYSASHYLNGQPLQIGYDAFGYNYQARIFVGWYYNFNTFGLPPYEGDDDTYYQRLVDEGFADSIVEAEQMMNFKPYWPYRDILLIMQWNDTWLSNMDRDGDGKLDRYFGYSSYIGSGAWETNHMFGMNPDGTKWDYFVKIAAAPADGYKSGGYWYTADNTEIGPVIWGSFATIQQVENDPSAGTGGILYKSPAGPGFGKW